MQQTLGKALNNNLTIQWGANTIVTELRSVEWTGLIAGVSWACFLTVSYRCKWNITPMTVIYHKTVSVRHLQCPPGASFTMLLYTLSRSVNVRTVKLICGQNGSKIYRLHYPKLKSLWTIRQLSGSSSLALKNMLQSHLFVNNQWQEAVSSKLTLCLLPFILTTDRRHARLVSEWRLRQYSY